MNELVLTLVAAAAGFFFSQFFNIVDYFRRPKFKIISHGEGVISGYTGDPPDTAWEIELGFYLENIGANPAKNTRIFVSELFTWNDEKDEFEETLMGFSALRRPIDVIPSGQAVRVLLGKISGDDCSLRMPLVSPQYEDEDEFLESDTRFKKKFRVRIFVSCDDRNSAKDLVVEFNPQADTEWCSEFLQDYDSVEFRKSITMPALPKSGGDNSRLSDGLC